MTDACASRYATLLPRARAWRSSSSGIGAIRSVCSIRLHQTMLKPPLMLSTWPVIQPLCGEASSATIGATSSGQAEPAHRIEPHQLVAVRLDPVLVVGGLDQPERDRVAVVPERPNSRASDFISATTPARAAATIARPDSPTREESPMTLTMRPFFAASRCGAAAWQQWIAP